MTYEEAREYLNSVAAGGSVLGLENITALLEELGDPQDKLKFVHIAGTNGKGSTLAFISTILKESGLKVGRYVSPTVVCYEERIQVNGEYITKEALSSLTPKVKAAAERVSSLKGLNPTVFEIETAIAFLYFLECGCDIVTLECGMGGATDATNVVKTVVLSVIASISMDHIGVLGNNLAEIASQKAGIIKAGVPLVTVKQPPEVMKVLKDRAEEMNSVLTVADPDNIYDISYGDLVLNFSYRSHGREYRDLSTGLCGAYQVENAALALESCILLGNLGYNITARSIKAGLAATLWTGRFTRIHDNPAIIIDGAHNEAAAGQLAHTLQIYFTNRKLIFIMGVLRDKEYDKILDIMLPFAETTVTITPPNPRALSGTELAEEIKKRGYQAVPADSVKEALSTAIELSEKRTSILCFGSLYYLGEVIRAAEDL